MRAAIDELLARTGDVASRAQLLRVVSRNQLNDEIARRLLVAQFPRAYLRPWNLDHRPLLDRAALLSVGHPVALSHMSAVHRYSLVETPDDVHVVTPWSRHPLNRGRHLIVHRTRTRIRYRMVDGLPTVSPADALLQAWPMIAAADRRGPALKAVRERLVTPAELVDAVERSPCARGRADFRALARLLSEGCESELEIWGYLNVFDVPGLRHGVRQRWVSAGGRRYRLVLAFDEERVGVELDGYRYHSTPDQRERDMRKDSALASIGWVTLRFSHQRLHSDVDGCRRATLRTLAERRRQRLWLPSGV